MSSDVAAKGASSTREVVSGAMEAIGRLDTEAFTDHFSPDVVWEIVGGEYFDGGTPWAGGRRWEGKPSVVQDFIHGAFGQNFDLAAPFEIDVAAIHGGDGPTAAAEFTMTARTASGNDYKNNYCVVFTVADGLIVKVREYTNTLYQRRVIFNVD
jgi:uncharacterized protein